MDHMIERETARFTVTVKLIDAPRVGQRIYSGRGSDGEWIPTHLTLIYLGKIKDGKFATDLRGFKILKNGQPSKTLTTVYYWRSAEKFSEYIDRIADVLDPRGEPE